MLGGRYYPMGIFTPVYPKWLVSGLVHLLSNDPFKRTGLMPCSPDVWCEKIPFSNCSWIHWVLVAFYLERGLSDDVVPWWTSGIDTLDFVDLDLDVWRGDSVNFFVYGSESKFGPLFFKSLPFEVRQHVGHAFSLFVIIHDKACCPSLDFLQGWLVVFIDLAQVPNATTIL